MKKLILISLVFLFSLTFVSAGTGFGYNGGGLNNTVYTVTYQDIATFLSGSFGLRGTGIVGASLGVGKVVLTFPVAEIPNGSVINNITLQYGISSTSYTAGNSLQFNQIDSCYTNNTNATGVTSVWNNITNATDSRTFNVSTDVTTTGLKSVIFNSNGINDLQNRGLAQSCWSIGINGSDNIVNSVTISPNTYTYPQLVVGFSWGASGNGTQVGFNGDVTPCFGTVDNNSATIEVGVDSCLFGSSRWVGFMYFNLTNFSQQVNGFRIKDVVLKYNLTSETGTVNNLYFKRLNRTQIYQIPFPDNVSFANNISLAQNYTQIAVGALGRYDVDLGQVAALDLESQVNNTQNGYFSLGIESDATTVGYPNYVTLSSSRGGFVPVLEVTYGCEPPRSGNWTINSTCNSPKTIYIPGSIFIQDRGSLNNSVFNNTGTNMKFLNTNSYMYIYNSTGTREAFIAQSKAGLNVW